MGVLVFKISGRQRKTGCGGFDSHAIPIRCVSAYRERCAGRVRTRFTERLHPKLFGLKPIPDCAQRGLRPNRPAMRLHDQAGRIQRKAFLRPRPDSRFGIASGPTVRGKRGGVRCRLGSNGYAVTGSLPIRMAPARLEPFSVGSASSGPRSAGNKFRSGGLRRPYEAPSADGRIPRRLASGTSGMPSVWRRSVRERITPLKRYQAMHAYAPLARGFGAASVMPRAETFGVGTLALPRPKDGGCGDLFAENVEPMAFRSAEKKTGSTALAPRTPYCGTLWCRLKVAARHFLPLSQPPSFACGFRGQIRVRAASG